MDSPADYIYDSLPSDRAVRLIQIDPNAEALHGFSVRLRTYELHNCPSFCALSYTWESAIIPDTVDDEGGAEDDRQTRIDCEGQTVLAGENLLHFLCHARDHGWFTEDRPLEESLSAMVLGDERTSLPRFAWIDAISINQKDTRERSRQVSLMGQIYRTSSSVLVWFGKDNPPSGAERVLKTFVPAFLDLKRSKGLSLLAGKDPWCHDAHVEQLLGADACAVWRQDWITLFLFLARCRWLRRGWVVQEVALKALDDLEAITIVCGSLHMPWVDLYEFLAGLTSADWRRVLTARLRRRHSIPGQSRTIYSEMLQRALAIWTICACLIRDCVAGRTPRWLSREFDGQLSDNERAFTILFKILHGLRAQQFTDRRDTVYGFLGLLEAVMPPGAQQIVHPDYSLSDAEVLSHTTWTILSNMPYLDMLSAVQTLLDPRKHLGVDLPTWVGSFSLSLHSLRRKFRNSPFDASGTRSPCSLFRLENGGLTLVGRRACQIDISIQLHSNAMKSICWEQMFQKLAEHRRGKYPGTEEPYDEALSRALVGNTFHPNLKPKNYQSEFRTWWTTVLALRLRRLKKSSNGSPDYSLLLAGDGGSGQNWLPGKNAIFEKSEQAQRVRLPKGLIQTVTHRLWGLKSMFCTPGGQLGLGPHSMQSNDEVWILQGGRTPFILRKQEDGGYSFVGPAYLHAAMHGQLATPDFNKGMGPVTIY